MTGSKRRGRSAVLLVAGIVAATVAAAAPATGAEDRNRKRAAPPAAQNARANRGSGGWRAELFARGGAHALAADIRTELSLSGFDIEALSRNLATGDSETAWNYLAAGGVRLARGRSGIEITWTYAPNRLLTPAVADAVPFGVFELVESDGRDREDESEFRSGADSRARLLIGQIFREAPVFGSDVRLFVGLGGGWLRVRDDGSDRLMAGGDDPLGIVALAGRGFPGELPPLGADFRLTQARDRALFGGSLGVTFAVRNLIVRPRADAYWSGALLSDAAVTISGLTSATSASLTLSERVRPAFFLFSVDFGFAVSR